MRSETREWIFNLCVGFGIVTAIALALNFIAWGIPPVWEWAPQARAMFVVFGSLFALFSWMMRGS